MARMRLSDEERKRRKIEGIKRWAEANPEKVRMYKQRYRAANPNASRLADAKRKARDPELFRQRVNENARRWRERNPEKAKGGWARWRARNAEKLEAWRLARYKGGARRPHLTANQQAEIHQRYAAGMNFKEIAAHVGCTGATVARCLRATHDIRPRPVKSGPGSAGWKGGRVFAHGYVYVWLAPDDPMVSMRDKAGRVAEHRLVLARKLGRPLRDHETVHHIDGVATHNDPSNLQLRQGRHGNGVVLACLDCGSQHIGPITIAEAHPS